MDNRVAQRLNHIRIERLFCGNRCCLKEPRDCLRDHDRELLLYSTLVKNAVADPRSQCREPLCQLSQCTSFNPPAPSVIPPHSLTHMQATSGITFILRTKTFLVTMNFCALI